MSFELFEVPEGYETDLALIIVPYFDPKFAKRLIKLLSPNRVRFILDDGARPEELDKLKEMCGQTDVKIALGSARGIVHLKGFYFEFVKLEGKQRRMRRFLFGSANATVAAFSGKINAELIAEVDLSAGNDRELLKYLQNLVNTVESDGHERIKAESFGPLQHPPTLYLPSFRISPVGPSSCFDSWLQRGLLVAKYKDAQQFLNISIKLKKALPMDQVGEIFAEQGLIELGVRNVVRYPYIGQPPIEESDDDTATNWKASYCLWTHFGEWLSDDCYCAHRNIMQAKSSPSRQTKVKELLDHAGNKSWKDERRQAFLDTFDRIWQGLAAADINPFEFLEGDGGGINEVVLHNKFDKKIEADICLAHDDDFRNRYVNGYEFPKVPRFRQDTAAWESFVHSFGESIAVEATRSKPLSKIVKFTRTAFSVMGLELAEMVSTDITDKLRKSWSKTITVDDNDVTVGEFVSGYFQS